MADKTKSLVGSKGKLQLKGFKPGMKVCTRFPPEPSGYLHIGHMKAAMLNEYYAHSNGGELILRFDDTNPLKESQEFVDNIITDLAAVGIVPERISYTSDYFEVLIDYAKRFIKMERAYIDCATADEIHHARMEGLKTPSRDNSVEKNLELFDEMIKASEIGKKCVMRAKIDYAHKNKALRDPSLYRVIDASHYRTGRKFLAYPLYDFCIGIIDSLEGVTHALRSQEYSDRAPLYDWVVDCFEMRKPIIEVFSRMNFAYVLLSKRNLKEFVDNGDVEGWTDPRFPTIQGLKRRGLTLEAMREVCLSQGSSKNITLMEMEKIWTINKKLIDPIVPRYNAVDKKDASIVIITDANKEQKSIACHKKNADLGMKDVWYDKEILVDYTDAASFEANEEVTFMDWGNIIIDSKEKSTTDESIKVTAHLHLEGDFKTTKKKLTWISNIDNVELELRDYDYLITVPKIEEGMDFKDYINPKSLEISYAIGESAMRNLKVDDKIQIQRKGYFRVDKAFDGNKIVLNKIPDGSQKGPKVKANVPVKQTKQKKQVKQPKQPKQPKKSDEKKDESK